MKRHFLSVLFVISIFTFIACGGESSTPTISNNNFDSTTTSLQTYYIDAQNGNDANDGKTPQTAWKTVKRVNDLTISIGNKFLFHTDQKWHGQLEIKDSGTVENPIVIGSYGDGKKPIISAVGVQKIQRWYAYNGIGNDGLSAHFKEPVPDHANTWLAVILDSHPYRVKVDGKEILGAFDSTELGSNTKWSYNREAAGTVFYYYGDNRPDKIETNLYTTPLYIHDNAYINIKNITLKGGYVAGLFIEEADNITIKNITVGEMSKQGIYVKAEGSSVKNITIDSSIIDSKYTLDYSFTGIKEANGRTTTSRGAPEGIMFWGGVQDSIIKNNIIKNWTHANINFSADNGEELKNNKVFDNNITAPDIAYGGRIGVDGENAYGNRFYNNIIKDFKAPIQFNGHDNKFTNNAVENVGTSSLKLLGETGDAIVLQGYSSRVYNNEITGNTFRNIAGDAIKVLDNVDDNNTLTPNTI